jgi:hypothetical protein
LKRPKVYINNGYRIQGRISTQNLHELVTDKPTEHTYSIKKLIKSWFKMISLSIGELISANQYDGNLAEWTVELIKRDF